MSKPIIGITMDSGPESRNDRPFGRTILRREYIDRVTQAGGVPILIPPGGSAAEVVPMLDGWLIPGGNDIDPSLWGEEVHPEAELVDPERLALERELYSLIPPDLPVLGICYGCQFINVARGGSLHQHLPDSLHHDGHRGDAWQAYSIEGDTLLSSVIGQDAEGKSWHHQAINRVGEGLKVVAHHEDGTIEAVEATDRPWMVGLQWHPERSEAEASVKIFREFIRQAAAFKARRAGG